MRSLADKIRSQLKAGRTPRQIAAKYGCNDSYVRSVKQRTDRNGFPKASPGDERYSKTERCRAIRRDAHHRRYWSNLEKSREESRLKSQQYRQRRKLEARV